MKENVNHPDHYNESGYECFTVMEAVFGDAMVEAFCILNAFKYIWRHRKKNGNEDIRKAIWYLTKYLEISEKENNNGLEDV